MLFSSRLLAAALFFMGLPSFVSAQASCALAYNLTPGISCSNTTGDLQGATNSAPTGTCGGATSLTTNGVWYQFTAGAARQVITVSNLGSNLSTTTTYVQVLSGSCGSFTSLSCQAVSASSGATTLTTLTAGTVYYVRVYVTGSTTTGAQTNRRGFSICVTGSPNDECASDSTLVPGTTCSNVGGNLASATASSPAVASSCTATPGADVWYKFTGSSYPTISLSSIGTSLSSAGVGIQLFSGTCGSLTSIQCITGTSTSLSLNMFTDRSFSGLDPTATYYIRIYTPTTAPTGSNWTYNICITNPATTAAKVSYSKSYINVSKGTNGGVVEVGDTLEIRTTYAISGAGVTDSLSFNDTLFNTKGLALVPGSIALRTNEGLVYKSFTDASGDDAGWRYGSSSNVLDTVIRINFGTSASASNVGRLSYQSKPSVYNSTCVLMATYRAVVYASYNTKINFKTGSLTYRDINGGSTTPTKITFIPNNLMVYQSPGLCPNAVSASNAVGAETNGTFGTPSTVAPLARNRGTSSSTTYTYAPFVSGGGPQDLYYGIANNTSARFTTLNTWAKRDPSSPSYRVFNLWDIIGDHTGATNTATGNVPCDTTLPVSATNPCGYMLVINSAYKTDTAFQYTASNLCPNTYYEISAWFRNICSKCGCDSNGVGATSAGYIPFATGDSSGIQPNIAFDVNGTDYYTTGNIQYYNTATGGTDANNQWVKRGFTYLTGTSETSFTLTLRNNAPGGGGNDWAMDDISIATCLPNMQYSPTLTPNPCRGNIQDIRDTITSYFNNYVHYQWQRSIDNGATWTNVTTTGSPATPTPVTGGYRYVTNYTIPPSTLR